MKNEQINLNPANPFNNVGFEPIKEFQDNFRTLTWDLTAKSRKRR
jgi:hypothetical protein